MSLLEAVSIMPWQFWAVMGTALILSGWVVRVVTKRPADFDQLFYDRWMKRIDGDLRDVRRRYNHADRNEAYKIAFERLYRDLSLEIGPPSNFDSLPTAQRSVWINLFIRIRDVLYFR